MHKNIRRSLMAAAAASGIWALGTTGANAAELPVSTDTVTVTATDTDAVTGAVDDVTSGVFGKLPSKGIPENGLPNNTLPTARLSETATDAVEDAHGAADKAVTPAVPAVPAV